MLEIKLILCDSAQIYDGKLSMLGAGWWWIRPGIPYSVAALVEVPWDKTNTKLKGVFDLVDEDGQALSPDGTNPLRLEVEFEVGRPAGMKSGSSQRVPLFVSVFPMDVKYAKPGRYSWRLEVEHQSSSVSFDFVVQ